MHEAAFGRPDEARLAAHLRHEAALVSLVAERDGRVIAHALFSPVRVEEEGERASPPAACALGPIGVLPDAQGRGAGGALIRAGVDACRDAGRRLLFVLGAPPYYGRFGFVLAAPLGLHYESAAFDGAFQVQELVPGALAGVRGWVRYHAAFSELG